MGFLAANTLLGKVARLPLRLIPAGTVVPILSGPTRGARWIIGADIHRAWLGFYERDKQRLVKEALRPGDVFFDIGANVGIYSVLAVRAGAKVFAFEPLPRNVGFLRQHLAMNGAHDVTVIEAAVAEHTGTMKFDTGSDNKVGALSIGGALDVQAVRIDDLIKSGNIPMPNCVKMDIEGGEADAIMGMPIVLARKPTIFLATHGEIVKAKCLEILGSYGYRFRHLDERELIAH